MRLVHPALLLLFVLMAVNVTPVCSSVPVSDVRIAGEDTSIQENTAIPETDRGELGYPVPAPSDPDIVALTRRDGNRHYLHLYHVTGGMDHRITQQTRRNQQTGRSTVDYTRVENDMLMRKAGIPTGYFEGDMAWRPVLDQFGYQWFAFVATSGDKVQLHLGYISSNTTLNTVVFPIGFASVVTNPVFSPDGNALAFSADGTIHVEMDIGHVIRKRDFRLMDPKPLTEELDGPGESFFPAWSPDGSMIAYQGRPVDGDREGVSSLFVIDVAAWLRNDDAEVVPPSHPVSPESIDMEGITLQVTPHHLRPSWAPSGHTLAFYEHAGDAAESRYAVKQVRLLNIVRNREANRYEGVPIEHADTPYFAGPAMGFPRSAPQWTVLDYDGEPARGILWTQYNPELDHPLMFSHLGYYTGDRRDFQVNLFSFSNRFNWLERTRNNRYPTAIRSHRQNRFFYIAAAGDRDVLKVVDRVSSTSEPSVRREIHEVPALIRGGLYPGWGHAYIGEGRRGAYLAATFTAMAGVTGYASAVRYRTTGKSPGNTFLISLGAATAAVWAFNIFDLQRQFPVYRPYPVTSTFDGYNNVPGDRSGVDPEDDPIRTASKTRAIMLSALYPGLGHVYIGNRTKGYILGSTFTLLAGSTFAGAAYRYHYPVVTPSNEVLITMGAVTLGTWLFGLIDLHQSFRPNFFAYRTGPDANYDASPPRARLALTPRLEHLRLGNSRFRDYAAMGVVLSF
ncbi:MAG: hypothetical protein R6U28_05550 [Cyclonatronaceae bacterium]